MQKRHNRQAAAKGERTGDNEERAKFDKQRESDNRRGKRGQDQKTRNHFLKSSPQAWRVEKNSDNTRDDEQNRDLSACENRNQCDAGKDNPQPSVFAHRRLRQAESGTRYDGNDGGADAVEERLHNRQAVVSDVQNGNAEND